MFVNIKLLNINLVHEDIMRVQISKIERISTESNTQVYDIGVEGNHNFYASIANGSSLLVHNCHKTGSDKYSEIIDQFTCPRLGLSATPKRKDGRHVIMHSILGDVGHETKIKSLTPTVSVIRTGFVSNKMYKNWVYLLRHLEQAEKRVETILKFAYKDAKNGRSILMPVVHSSQVDSMVERLNAIGVKAIGWDGRLKAKDRAKPLEMSASGEVSVLVAQRSMLTGMNLPRWDMLYWVVPMNNEPNFEQEYKRVCTPMPGKPEPVVRFFVDDHEVVERCFFNSANVIKRDGGKFTKSALKDWTECGIKFKRLSPVKDVTPKECKSTKKTTTMERSKSSALFGDIHLDEDFEGAETKRVERKLAKAENTPKPKTSHLTRKL